MTTFQHDYKIALKNIEEKQYTKAYESLFKILEVEPLNSQVLLSFYKVSIYLKKYKEAKVKFSNYIKHNPKNYKALFFLGILYKQSLDFEKALIFFNKIKDTVIPERELWNHISECYYHLNQFKNTLKFLKKTLLMEPTNPNIIYKIAFVYKQIGDIDHSYEYYKKLSKFPNFQAIANFNLALLLQESNNIDKAIEKYIDYINIQPNNSDAHYALGTAYAHKQDFEKAIKSYKKALKLEKNHLQSKIELFSAKATICDWNSYDEDRNNFKLSLENIVNEGKINLKSFVLSSIYFDMPPELNLKIAKKCSFGIEKSLNFKSQHTKIANKTTDKRLKIGYLSPDFRDHAVGRLIYDIFRHHNRDKFEIFAYSLLDTNKIDFIKDSIEKGCDHFINCTSFPSLKVAQKIKKDNIDILVDMGGYTTYTKPDILALRPAPIQLHYLGNPNTMGADFIPYMLVDKYLLPEEYKRYFSEQPIYLKHSIVSSPLPKKIPKVKKKDYNLPENTFIYSSFNFPKKLNPEVFKVWMDILNEVPKSVFWLYATSKLHEENLLKFVKLSGISTDRVIFANNVSYSEYLARFQLADIFLDNFQYGAGSTAANSLMMGCPLLTLSGDNLVSRLGSSVNAAAGMNDWICYSKKEYFDKAVYWSKHQQELRDIKCNIKDKVKKSNLCNIKALVRDLENNFEKLISKKQDFFSFIN